jgi:hypothetical protein
LKTLRIGTRGTKLSSAGVKEMVEGCVGLERLELDGVEGGWERYTILQELS